MFLARWEVKKNSLQFLAEYNALERNPGEYVQEFIVRFNKIYNSISVKIKPPPGLALLHYPGCFDAELAYQLRETNATTLEQMQNNAIGVEANLSAKKAKMKVERRVGFKEESSSSPDFKFDVMLKTMGKLVDKLTPPWDDMHDRAYFLLQQTHDQYAMELKDFIHGEVDWFKNPILAPNAFEEGNMATIKINISNKPRIEKNIILGAHFTLEEIDAYIKSNKNTTKTLMTRGEQSGN